MGGGYPELWSTTLESHHFHCPLSGWLRTRYSCTMVALPASLSLPFLPLRTPGICRALPAVFWARGRTVWL